METEAVFILINMLPVPIWLSWMLAPRSAISRYLARAMWPFAVLAGVYVVLLATAVVAGPMDGDSFSSLEGVMALFSTEWGMLAGWAHYLCFDLFVARWIIEDAPEAGFRLLPILVLTMLAGPLGLLTYLAVRHWLIPARVTS